MNTHLPTKLQDQLAEEAALRARSLQRTRKLRARERHRQRVQRAQRVQEVGELVAACGLLWLENAQLTALLTEAQRLVEQDLVPANDCAGQVSTLITAF